MRYESNPKHKDPWQSGRQGTLCPGNVDQAIAERLLEDSETSGNVRYAVHEGRAYCARKHGDDVWHGYPLGWEEVPESLRRRWVREGRVRRRDINRYWQG